MVVNVVKVLCLFLTMTVKRLTSCPPVRGTALETAGTGTTGFDTQQTLARTLTAPLVWTWRTPGSCARRARGACAPAAHGG